MDQQPEFTLGQRFKMWLVSHLGAWVLRLLFSTCRVEMVEGGHVLEDAKAGRLRAVGATWHRGAIFCVYFFGPLRPVIMVSRSKDGEFLTRYLALMGCRPVRGSSSKGGMEALAEMKALMSDGEYNFAATVSDGPRGPRYQAKAGMVVLAMRTGLPLVPVMWSCDRAWVFKKAWDRTMIPKPFAKVKVAAGQPRHIPSDLSKEGVEQARLGLEQELNRLRDSVDGLCHYRDPD